MRDGGVVSAGRNRPAARFDGVLATADILDDLPLLGAQHRRERDPEGL
ncbi:hypothetical protein ACWZEH_04095 [Streptomyces sp. QTS137]